ncbi:MAG: PE-PGRS family protein [Deltaproteobacteria bacterium]|nr:PE-PGRS family protein [Deltaproteobacteria bacterium]
MATCFASLASLVGTASAETINVSNVAELRAALSSVKAGDQVVLASGTYAVSGANLSCAAAGTPTSPIVVRSATPLGAKLELSTVEGFVVTGPSWHFEGLDVKGTCASDSDCEHAFHVSGAATGFVLKNSRIVDFNAQLKVNASPGGAQIPHRGLVEGCELFDTHARATDNPITKLNIDTGDDWIVRANHLHDFHRANGAVTYGAFMKSGGRNGVFERNLVVCTKDETTPGTHIGLSFGGGGTLPQFCAPAFDMGTACDVEHDGGTMRNNIVANCSDVGVYLNRAKNARIVHNTLVAASGIDFRFATTAGEARGNVLTGSIRNRDGATHVDADNLNGVTQATFEAMYVAPLAGDLRKKGDLGALLGKAPVNHAGVVDDYCARARTGAWDLGALQHALGDCVTIPPPVGTGGSSSSGADGGASSGGTASSSSGATGSSGDASGSSGSPPGEGDDERSGCAVSGSPRPLFFGAVVSLAALGLARKRRRARPHDEA